MKKGGRGKVLCRPKMAGGLGCRDYRSFNLALLAKQGWRLLNNPSSLVAQVLKAKYFYCCDFMHATIGGSLVILGVVFWQVRRS